LRETLPACTEVSTGVEGTATVDMSSDFARVAKRSMVAMHPASAKRRIYISKSAPLRFVSSCAESGINALCASSNLEGVVFAAPSSGWNRPRGSSAHGRRPAFISFWIKT
jgi:hypothetical protein